MSDGAPQKFAQVYAFLSDMDAIARQQSMSHETKAYHLGTLIARTKRVLDDMENCAPKEDRSGLFTIENNVPVPETMTLNRKFYPWQQMDAGDSFFVEGGKVTALSAKASWAGRQYSKQYVCRTVDGGVRVWCLGHRSPRAPRKANQHAAATPAHPSEE